jgi:hypothetical protein
VCGLFVHGCDVAGASSRIHNLMSNSIPMCGLKKCVEHY